jgi:hypothetical protein
MATNRLEVVCAAKCDSKELETENNWKDVSSSISLQRLAEELLAKWKVWRHSLQSFY